MLKKSLTHSLNSILTPLPGNVTTILPLWFPVFILIGALQNVDILKGKLLVLFGFVCVRKHCLSVLTATQVSNTALRGPALTNNFIHSTCSTSILRTTFLCTSVLSAYTSHNMPESFFRTPVSRQYLIQAILSTFAAHERHEIGCKQLSEHLVANSRDMVRTPGTIAGHGHDQPDEGTLSRRSHEWNAA